MSLFRSLSGRLLLVTIAAVMLVEVAIFVPSVARFREDYLLERVRRAEIATLIVLAAPDGMIDAELSRRLLARTETLNIVLRAEGMRELILMSPEIGPIEATYDLREPMMWDLIVDALHRIAGSNGGIIRVIAHAPSDVGNELEITLPAGPLRDAMRGYGWRILKLSLIISLISAAMVFFSMRRFVVGPIRTVIENVERFSEDPEDARRIIAPSSNLGEVAAAERALASMQREVHGALKSRGRLAALGEAVAKISHDLRNILATTQLMADRLEGSSDPIVARTTPKLIASLDRAIRLCQSTLTFGRADEAAPEQRNVALRAMTEEVAEGLGLWPASDGIRCDIEVPAELAARADPEHLYRVLNNLLRNAGEALRTSGGGVIRVEARAEQEQVAMHISDNGPGMPAKALENLFRPFRGGTRQGGTGLGLAISHELIAANGGRLRLVGSTTEGTEFQLTLPKAMTP